MSAPPRAAAPQAGFGWTDAGLLLMATIWAVNFTIVKHGLETIPAAAFNGLRVTLAAVVLGAIAAMVAGRRHFPAWRDAFALLGMGVLGNGVYQLCFMAGLERTRAGIAALIMAAGPAWIAIFSRLLGRDHPSARAWLGIALQLVGVGCVMASAGRLDADPGALTGAAFIMTGSITWAVFALMLQPYTHRVHPLHLSALTLTSGATLLAVVGLPAIRALDIGALSLAQWGTIAYAGVGALVIAYLLYYRGVRVLGPMRTAMYGNLQPVIAILVAWAFLHEQPGPWQLTGGALVLAGLFVSRSRHTTTARPAPAVHVALEEELAALDATGDAAAGASPARTA